MSSTTREPLKSAFKLDTDENTDPNIVVNPSDEKTKMDEEVHYVQQPRLRRKETKKERVNKMILKMREVQQDSETHHYVEGADSETDSSNSSEQDSDSSGDDDESKGNCVKAAIYKGFIEITGSPDDLKMVVYSEEGECGHIINATLGDLLKQPDYAGTDYEDGLQGATVVCTVKGCDPEYEGMGRTYVTNLCTGSPYFTNGKAHNHCNDCKIFGECIGDYRNTHCDECGDHYFAGFRAAFECPCQKEEEEGEEEFPDFIDMFIEMYLNQLDDEEGSGAEDPNCNEQ